MHCGFDGWYQGSIIQSQMSPLTDIEASLFYHTEGKLVMLALVLFIPKKQLFSFICCLGRSARAEFHLIERI